MAIATVPGAVMAAVMLLASERVTAFFSTDAAVVAEAAHYLRIAALCQVFLGAEIVLEGAMGGAGYTFAPMVLSVAITASRVPLGAWSAAQWGTTGLWWTLSLTACARGVAMAVLWYSLRWQRPSRADTKH